MTDAEKLAALKAMGGGSDADEVLSTYLSIAGEIILSKAYPYDPEVTEIPAKYNYLQVEIADYLLSKRGGEYQTSHSENGISRVWESSGVPASLLSRIVPNVGVI